MPDAPPRVEIQLVAPNKVWSRSRTLWVNAGIAVATAALASAEILLAESAIFRGLVTPRTYLLSMTALAACNVLLRVVTRTGIVWRKPEGDAP